VVVRGKLSECETLSALHNHKWQQIPQTFKTCECTKGGVYEIEGGNKSKCQKCSTITWGR